MRGKISVRRRLVSFASALSIGLILVGPLPNSQASTPLAAIIDGGSHKVVVFNPVTDVVVGASTTVPSLGPYQCRIVGSKVYFTNFDNMIHTAALSSTVALGRTIATPADLGLSLTVDKRGSSTYLVTGGGPGDPSLAVVNVAKRKQVHSLNIGAANEAQRAPDGSVLSMESSRGIVHRVTVSRTGALKETPALTGVPSPIDIVAPRSGPTAVVLSLNGTSSSVRSFAVPSLRAIDTFPLSESPFTGAISKDGTKLYVLTDAHLLGFHYNPNSGVIGSPLFAPSVATSASAYLGGDELGLDPTDAHLYVPVSGGEEVFSATSGAYLGTMTGTGLSSPEGICFSGQM